MRGSTKSNVFPTCSHRSGKPSRGEYVPGGDRLLQRRRAYSTGRPISGSLTLQFPVSTRPAYRFANDARPATRIVTSYQHWVAAVSTANVAVAPGDTLRDWGSAP